MTVRFEGSKHEAANIKTFYFRPEQSVHYTAGQFIELTLKHGSPDKRGTKRWFTLSSSPTDELFSITTKLTPEKGSTFKLALNSLKTGDEVLMSQPMGDFVLPKLIQTPLVFVAGGIGITPFHSILKWLTDTGEKRDITLIYAVKNEEEIIFQDTFDKAKQHATIVVSEPSAAWGGERGRITAELIQGIAKPSEDSLIYVSGPEQMVEQLHKDLHKAGIRKDHLVGDFFPNYSGI